MVSFFSIADITSETFYQNDSILIFCGNFVHFWEQLYLVLYVNKYFCNMLLLIKVAKESDSER